MLVLAVPRTVAVVVAVAIAVSVPVDVDLTDIQPVTRCMFDERLSWWMSMISPNLQMAHGPHILSWLVHLLLLHQIIISI